MNRLRIAIAIVATVCFVPALRAADAKPDTLTPKTLRAAEANTLTPKEIEEGWILLFDGETTLGWKPEGDVKLAEGELQVGGTKKSSITTTSIFGPCDMKCEYFLKGKASFTAASLSQEFPNKEEFLGYWTETKIAVESNRLSGSHHSSFTKTQKLDIGSITAFGVTQEIGSKTAKFPDAPIRFEVQPDAKLSLKSIKLKPKDAKPLFNGKDLTGWRIFDDPKRNQSKWTVTKEGWLNVKNGPGDLQSEGQYADFLLQFECISNGKALNSGLFFRCIANEYQNGYEAQVQNGFKDDDRAKPADFGTGAIYRRVAARKVVSNDNEWFTMTVLAHGNHFATWVNGYQTVDWTDDRPTDNNPRKGSKTGAGHLSIQGHDPTTDLSFRNIRIVELKSDKK